jgi:hypothetical protein
MSEDHDVIGERVKAHRVERGANLCRAIADKLGVASIPRNPEMLVGRWCVVEGGVRTWGNDIFCRKTVQQVCGGAETLYPILWWHESLKHQTANNVVGGAQHMLNFTVLRRGVWAGHPEVHAMTKEKLSRGVVELTHIVTLDALNRAAELSAHKRKELGDSQKRS